MNEDKSLGQVAYEAFVGSMGGSFPGFGTTIADDWKELPKDVKERFDHVAGAVAKDIVETIQALA